MSNFNDSFICNISGLKYHLYKNQFPIIGDTLVLIPEPNNQYDKNAIGVYDVHLRQLGYIPKTSGANFYIGGKISWKPYFAKVKSVYQDLGAILIKIDF